nr:retrovirus-related Pol polyprotein from transposon TNT 1-94 [Tanacetum cinerariifolium]
MEILLKPTLNKFLVGDMGDSIWIELVTLDINLGTKDAANQEVKKYLSSLRYITLPNWAHDALLEFPLSKPQDHCNTEVPKDSGNTNPIASTPNPPADPMETLTVETSIPTVSSPVPTAYSTDTQEPSSDARLISKRVANQEETPSLDNILSLINRFEDILGGTTNSDESNGEEADMSNIEIAITASPTPTLRIYKDHPKSMQEELLQFKIQNVWTLVDCPKGVRPIGTKWVLKNKKNERGIVIRNKARLVAQGNTQQEEIDYDEVFAPVARIEAIRLFLAYASFMGFIVYQMDVKSAFLYGTIDEEVILEPGMVLVEILIEEWFSKGHQVTPKECHLHAIKRIFRYLKGHPKLRLWYPKESPFDLVAFLDSDYGGATQDRKSTTEGCQFLGLLLIIEDKFLPLGIFLTARPNFSHIRQFWSTARIETTEKETKILATVDGIVRTVSESSLSQGEACPTDSGFIADQDRATIDKSSTLPHDTAPRVTSHTAVEGSMQQSIPKLTALYTSLQRQLSELTAKFQAQEVEIHRLKERVKLLETREGVATTRSRDDAPIKRRSMNEGEVATERVNDDTEEMATMLTSMDAATVLASRVVDVPTGSGFIPTAGPLAEGSVPTGSEEVPTASPVFATATMVARELEEQLAREDQRRAEQIARDAEIARIHAEEELQIMISGLDRNNETIAKYLEEY